MFSSYRPFRRNQVPNWEHVKVSSGKAWHGWLAGPVWGGPTHYMDRTRGCRSALTNGALKCWCDEVELETRWRGYAPLWDADGVRWVAILGERFGRSAMELKHGEPVAVQKLAVRGSPIRVCSIKPTTTPPRLSKADQKPQDIRRWLLRIWKDEELEQWVSDHPEEGGDINHPVPFTRPDVHLVNRLDEIKERIVLKPNAKDAKIPDTLEKLLGKREPKNGKPH